MKKIIGRLSLLTIFVLAFTFIYPTDVSALMERTDYIDINNIGSLEAGSLSFSNISFGSNSFTSPSTFGLTGQIVNQSDEDIGYHSTIYYFDSNYLLIGKVSSSGVAPRGTSNFNQMSDQNILSLKGIDEIYYYSLTINTKENKVEKVSNTPSKNDKYSLDEYVIDKYDVDMVVHENNTFDITETITAYFNVPKHGIFRTIPLKNTITRLDGTTSTNRAEVTNISVDHEYKVLKEGQNYKIQIGSANQTITKEQTYVIKYTYKLGKDPVRGYDELYYNIIGTDWDAAIGNISFKITMPKEFDPSKLGFSSGSSGSIDNSNVRYTINGNTIKGSYNGILNKWEALTVRCELPNEYFTGAGFTLNSVDYMVLLLPILFLGISILLWYTFGRDEKVIETVEFYPPAGLNSLEVGFLYKGKAKDQDVTSLLIYLANQGYIKISETKDGSLFSNFGGFKLSKLKEYDGNNLNEKIFFDGLFSPKVISLESGQAEVENVSEVTAKDLYDSFYMTIKKILLNINSRENKYKIFEKKALNKMKFIIMMMIATYCLITIPPIFTYGESSHLLLIFLCPPFIFFTLFTVFKKMGGICARGLVLKIFGLMLGLSATLSLLRVLLPLLKQDSIYLMGSIIGSLCIIGMIICLKKIPKRTPYGNEGLGKLKGFKNFLETAEKDKLEAMVMQNPTYFYHLLPYAYVLGVSDKWIKKFEVISMQAPSWYDSSRAFDMASFHTFMNTTITSAQSAMSYSSNRSSNGFSNSGGGSSGGGSGGGGGGSW